MKRYVNGDEHELTTGHATVEPIADRLVVHTSQGRESALTVRVGDTTHVSFRGRQYAVTTKSGGRGTAGVAASSGEIRAPMPGTIVDVKFASGDEVKKGDIVVILEAMKTQQPFSAPFDGIIEKIFVKTGDQASESEVLAIIQPILGK